MSISLQRVNCAWKSPSLYVSWGGPRITTALSHSPGPGAHISPLNSNIDCPKRACGFCCRLCERKGQRTGSLNPEPEAERTSGWMSRTTWGSPAWHTQGCPEHHCTSPLTGELSTPRMFFLLSRGGWALSPLETVHGLTAPHNSNINPIGTTGVELGMAARARGRGNLGQDRRGCGPVQPLMKQEPWVVTRSSIFRAPVSQWGTSAG